jgi:hypothetical protein
MLSALSRPGRAIAFAPDPSVRGSGAPRLLLSSHRRGPGYRNGDNAIVAERRDDHRGA